MKYPKVSIITPSLNQGQFIEETIISVKNQDYPNIEHIVIDGGSKDGTIDILKKYPHLIWKSQPDKGQSDALNKGFRMAKGEIIGWLNSDDTYLPKAISTAVNFFQSNPEYDMVYGDFCKIDGTGKVFERRKQLDFTLLGLKSGLCYICQPTVFFRKRVFDKMEYLDVNLRHAMDYDLWMRIALNFKVKHIPGFVANFRYHKDSKTVSEFVSQIQEERLVRNRYWKGDMNFVVDYFLRILRFYYRIRWKLATLNL
ncbi:Chondroitin synthase [subsurface metagenome]